MLRLIFVFSLLVVGVRYAATSALGALLFYLWIAYFRPDAWLYDASLLNALNLSLISGSYLVIRVLFTGEKLKFDLRALLLLAFVVVGYLSTLNTLERTYAYDWWAQYARAAMVCYVISIMVTDGPRFRLVLIVIALSLSFEGAKQGWVMLITNPGGRNHNTLPMLGDNNGVAVGMLMLVAAMTALIRTSTKQYQKLGLAFLAIGVAFRALQTYSRGGFLAAGTLAAVATLRSQHKARATLGIGVVAVLLLSVLPQQFWDRMSTIKTSEEELEEVGDASSLSRLHFWRVAVDMANDHPVLGVGFFSYSRYYDEYDYTDGRFGRAREAHSAWFATLAELGYTGLILLVSIFVLGLIATEKARRAAVRGILPMEFFHYGVGIQSAFLSCAVGITFLSWQYYEMLWHFVGLSMALNHITNKAYAQVDRTEVVSVADRAAAMKQTAAERRTA
jgi:probable O-glycosylation ligase (exosortase A-associated)